MLQQENRQSQPVAVTAASAEVVEFRPAISNNPNHTWTIDLTLVPTTAGFWAIAGIAVQTAVRMVDTYPSVVGCSSPTGSKRMLIHL